jgi:hypothetical protein
MSEFQKVIIEFCVKNIERVRRIFSLKENMSRELRFIRVLNLDFESMESKLVSRMSTVIM